MFLLKLLGLGKFLRDFLVANWKWALPLIGVLALFLWTKGHYYDLGKLEERNKWEERARKDAEKSVDLTTKLANSVGNLAERVITQQEERSTREVIREKNIQTIVENNPVYTECKVDQTVLDEQNAIKEGLK